MPETLTPPSPSYIHLGATIASPWEFIGGKALIISLSAIRKREPAHVYRDRAEGEGERGEKREWRRGCGRT